MHIMKTAGTSLAHHIARNFERDEIYPTARDPENHDQQYWLPSRFAELDPTERAKLRIICGHFPFFTSEVVGADVIITLLRDPIERTISHMAHVRRFGTDPDVSLESVYEGPENLPMPFVNYQISQFARHADGAIIIDIDDALYQRALENLDSVTLLGLSDQYEEFTAALTHRFGWRNAPPDRLQVAPEPTRVSAAFRRRLERDNEADIDFYRHARQLVESRKSARP